MQLPHPALDPRALRAALQAEQAQHRPEAVSDLLRGAAAALREAAGPVPTEKNEVAR